MTTSHRPMHPSPAARDDARDLYDDEYAARYDEDFQEGPIWSAEAAHHVRSLEPLVGPGVRWLDVGCGTGWFLSQFPGVARAGLDYSPAMLARARAANPDAMFLREGDARVDVPEWHDEWDVVSCTGQPYSYFRTMDEAEALARNLAAWTKPGGTCFVQVCDLLDLSGYQPSYDFEAEITPGHSISITGALWTWADTTGTVHRDMLWPSLDVWVRWFARWFRRIDVVHWPHDPPYPYLQAPRRLLLLTEKRVEGDDGAAAEIVVHPPPEVEPAPAEDSIPADEPAPADVPAPADEAVPAGGPVLADEPTDPDPARPGRRHRPGRPLPGRLVDQPLSYLLSKAKPWDPRFWGRVARRLPTARR